MKKDFAIIVPYRDRRNHLERFIPHMNKYVPDAQIFIVEQIDTLPFNRAALLNYGAIFADYSHFVCHDVDHLPVRVDYTLSDGVTQLASNGFQTKDFLGAATMFDMETFKKIGGYNGDYFSRGEDNELFFQIKRLGIKIKKREGMFKVLQHERPWKEFDPIIWRKAQFARTKNYLDPEKTLNKAIIHQVKEDHIHLKISLI